LTSASGPQERVPQVPPTGDQKEIFRNLGGQVRSTVKEIVSVLRGHRQGAEIPGDPARIHKEDDHSGAPEYWKDWRWQFRHLVRDIDTFQQLLGITFSKEERALL
jgi:hypothetical protein